MAQTRVIFFEMSRRLYPCETEAATDAIRYSYTDRMNYFRAYSAAFDAGVKHAIEGNKMPEWDFVYKEAFADGFRFVGSGLPLPKP